MKKFLALTMALLMLFTLVACSNNTEGTESEDEGIAEVIIPTEGTEPDERPSEPSNETTEPTTPENSTSDPTKPDEEYFVDLETEVVVYEKNNIKITFLSANFKSGTYDMYDFKIENNSKKDIMFSTSTVLMNGCTLNCAINQDNTVMAGETKTVTARAMKEYRTPVLENPEDIKCLEFEAFIVENPGGEYKKFGQVIEKNFKIKLTQGNHDHKNDKVLINGELAYEDDEIALYINLDSSKNAFADAFAYTLVNKTNKPLYFDIEKAQYKTVDIKEFYLETTTVGANAFLSPYGFRVGEFKLFNAKFQDITEMKLTLTGSEATQLDVKIGNSFARDCQCEGKELTLFTISNRE